MDVDLGAGPVSDIKRDDKILFSESAGRFIVSIDPQNKDAFEDNLSELPYACIGKVTDSPHVEVKGLKGQTAVSLSLHKLKIAWKRLFGELI